ncbi:MAG: hypothetical protein LBD60_01050 [Puniceicoccales bacterium]|jgi:hypothetical protein|nr:hypothetical protein [Puniceicoccales bacterium]
MLKSLKDFVDDGCTDPSKLSDEFKNLFLSVTMYMQSGQYHSAGEVLGGLYCAALTLAHDSNLDPKNFDQIAPKFQAMWQAFKANPEDFFPLSPDDSKKFKERGPDKEPKGVIQGIVKNLQGQHKKAVERRHDEAMETLETLREARRNAGKFNAADAAVNTLGEQEAEERKLREDFMKQYTGVYQALDRKRSSEAPDKAE